MSKIDVSIQDFPNICRLCLRTGDLQKFKPSEVMTVYKIITNIEVNENDTFPENICNFCIDYLEDISSFIERCKSNHTFLKTLYTELEQKIIVEDNDSDTTCDFDGNEFNIKTELKTEHSITCDTDEEKSIPNELIKVEIKNFSTNKKKYSKKHPQYKCPQCYRTFVFAENLRRHAKIHNGLKPFVCEICEKGFLRKRSLDEHMNFHTGKTPYICVYCGKGFKRHTDHNAHIYHNHKENTQEIPKLKRKYTEKRVHLNIECKTCGKIFASRSGYANHQLIHDGVKKFLCNVCGRKFITNPSLESHIRTHTGEKPFECKECGKCFRQRNSLNVHMSHHLTDKSLNCPQCNKTYYTKISLNNHMTVHSTESVLECPHCQKQFHQKNAFHNHVLKHTAEKSHKCHLCKKSFLQRAHLNVHIRTHSGEKPYPCTICGKKLAQPQTLKVHMRQHTGETPYMCSVCNKGFHDSSNLKRHFNRHHNGDSNKKNTRDEENLDTINVTRE